MTRFGENFLELTAPKMLSWQIDLIIRSTQYLWIWLATWSAINNFRGFQHFKTKIENFLLLGSVLKKIEILFHCYCLHCDLWVWEWGETENEWGRKDTFWWVKYEIAGWHFHLVEVFLFFLFWLSFPFGHDISNKSKNPSLISFLNLLKIKFVSFKECLIRKYKLTWQWFGKIDSPFWKIN